MMINEEHIIIDGFQITKLSREIEYLAKNHIRSGQISVLPVWWN